MISTTAPFGPTYVCLDAGWQEQQLNGPFAMPDPSRYEATEFPAAAPPAAIARAVDMIANAKRPVIFVGRVTRNPDAWKARTFVNRAQYDDLYAKSVAAPEDFWRGQAETMQWIKPFTKVKDVSYDAADLHIKWFYDGTLNVCANCIDRHLPQRANQTAILWEGDDPKD